MNLKSIMFLIVLCILDRVLAKKAPHFYKKMDLPINILLSFIAAVYCGLLIYAGYDVLTSCVSHDDKVFFVIFMGEIFSVYVTMVLITWRGWFKAINCGK